MLVNFEGLVLFSPSDIRQEVCISLITISQGIDWYKVLVVGKNGKLNDTIEASALWSILMTVRFTAYLHLLHVLTTCIICRYMYVYMHNHSVNATVPLL